MNLFARKGKLVLDEGARRIERAIARETKSRVFSGKHAFGLIGAILAKSSFDADFNVEARSVTLRFRGGPASPGRDGGAG